jgi:hypothetical protein
VDQVRECGDLERMDTVGDLESFREERFAHSAVRELYDRGQGTMGTIWHD